MATKKKKRSKTTRQRWTDKEYLHAILKAKVLFGGNLSKLVRRAVAYYPYRKRKRL